MNPLYNDLKDKTILITGATRGIGETISLELARQGAHVVYQYRDETKAQHFHDKIQAFSNRSTGLQFDVTKKNEIDEAIKRFLKEKGPIHGLINNAGVSKDGFLMRLKEEDIDSVLDTNLKGAMLVTSALAMNFLRVPGASIINMSSVVGLMGNAGQTAYAASKAGLIGFTKALAKELAPKGVRVNAICPGLIDTDMTRALDEKTREDYVRAVPLGRMGKSEDVAQLCSFLLSDASSYITGECIKVDGGIYI